MKKKIMFLILGLLSIFTVSSCKNKKEVKDTKVSILATSDVHCGVEDNLGYATLAGYRNKRADEGYSTTLVDCGDAIQGDTLGLLSNGEYIIDIMNETGYDIYTIGNHEFDYGIPNLSRLIDKFNGDTLSCNIEYTGDLENELDNVKPYVIKNYDDYKIGYVGITTPKAITTSTPSVFKDNGEYVYGFSYETTEGFYDTIQTSINNCKSDGADMIILLSHLGYGEEYGDCGSVPTMQNLSGYDIILDGHSHKVLETEYYKDKDGIDRPLVCLGTKLASFAEVVVDNESFEINYIKDYDGKDEAVEGAIDGIFFNFNELLETVISTSDIKLDMYEDVNGNSIRLPRNQETAIGNFYADAYRSKYGTDIGIINGGGIRSGFDAGNINYAQLYKMVPFGNFGCVIEATGKQIADYLEFTSRLRQKESNNGTKAVGENGAFANVSGLKYTIDTTIPSSITDESFDENGLFVGTIGERRVKNILVMDSVGEYVPIDLTKKYSIATITYIAFENGDGNTLFDGCKVIEDAGILDIDIIKDYFLKLNGNISAKYSSLEGRINIITE